MGRLIDADAIPYTVAYKENWMDGTGKEERMVWKSDIDKMPTVEERKTGHWVEDKEASKNHVEKIYRCSACNDFEAWGTTELYNFCPNCGADMRGVKHD